MRGAGPAISKVMEDCMKIGSWRRAITTGFLRDFAFGRALCVEMGCFTMW
jgi:hypothetical protein